MPDYADLSSRIQYLGVGMYSIDGHVHVTLPDLSDVADNPEKVVALDQFLQVLDVLRLETTTPSITHLPQGVGYMDYVMSLSVLVLHHKGVLGEAISDFQANEPNRLTRYDHNSVHSLN